MAKGSVHFEDAFFAAHFETCSNMEMKRIESRLHICGEVNVRREDHKENLKGEGFHLQWGQTYVRL